MKNDIKETGFVSMNKAIRQRSVCVIRCKRQLTKSMSSRCELITKECKNEQRHRRN